jgi:Tfp pilus assembly protein PilV
MLLIYFLVFSIVVLLAYSLSKETGKNTKHARKRANAIAEKPHASMGMRANNVIEIN